MAGLRLVVVEKLPSLMMALLLVMTPACDRSRGRPGDLDGGAANGTTDGGVGSPPNDAGGQMPPVVQHPPSVPGGLRITHEDACDTATLSWDGATADPAGAPLRGYRVYVDGYHRFTTLTTSQSLRLDSFELAAGIPYSLTVAAFAEDGAVSAPSQPLVYTPALCSNAPDPPTNVQGKATSCREVTLSWTPATKAGTNDGVYGYIVHRDGALLTWTMTSSYQDYGVPAGSTHQYVVQTRSNQALVSSPRTLQVTTPSCTDTQPPSKPLQLRIQAYPGAACQARSFEWNASSDNVGVHHYNVYRDGVVMAQTTDTRVNSDLFLAPLVTYQFTVSALDDSGNESERSDPVTLRFECPPPSQTRFESVVLLANFADVRDTPISIADATQRAFGPSRSFASYMSEASYGLLDFHGGKVFGWYTLPKPVGVYCPGPGNIDCSGHNDDLMAAAKGDLGTTVYDRYLRVYQGIGEAGFGGGESIDVSFEHFDIGTMAHEIGHTLGLDHAGLLTCGGGELTAPNLLDLLEGGCSPGRYDDGYDVMGAGNEGHYNAFNKEILGALPAKQVAIADQSGSYTLEVLESPGTGLKELRIPLEQSGFFYFLEYRQPLGTDAAGGVDGVLIRLHLGGLETLGSLDTTTQRIDMVLNPGQPFFDRYRNIRVEATAKTTTTISLKVTR